MKFWYQTVIPRNLDISFALLENGTACMTSVLELSTLTPACVSWNLRILISFLPNFHFSNFAMRPTSFSNMRTCWGIACAPPLSLMAQRCHQGRPAHICLRLTEEHDPLTFDTFNLLRYWLFSADIKIKKWMHYIHSIIYTWENFIIITNYNTLITYMTSFSAAISSYEKHYRKTS